MCFSIPKKITHTTEHAALLEDGSLVEMGGVNAKPGEYILVYGNMAVSKISEEDAIKTREIIGEIDAVPLTN